MNSNDLWEALGSLDNDQAYQILIQLFARYEEQQERRPDDPEAQAFFQALATHGGITLHVDLIHGLNSHHIAEAAFKSVARALREAVEPDPRLAGVLPSTKGAL